MANATIDFDDLALYDDIDYLIESLEASTEQDSDPDSDTDPTEEPDDEEDVQGPETADVLPVLVLILSVMSAMLTIIFLRLKKLNRF